VIRKSALLALVAVGTSNAQPSPPQPATAPATGPLASVEQSVRDALDPDADACEDFYQFACGGWLEKTTLPADKTSVTRSFTTISDDNQAMLKELLEQAAANPGDDEDLRKVGAFYGACMDEAAIEKADIAPIAPLLKRIAKAKTTAQLWGLVGGLHLEGADPLFAIGVEPDYKNPEINKLIVMQGGLGLPDRSFYLEEDSAPLKAAYQELVTELLALSGLKAADAARLGEQVVAFETKLAEAAVPRSALRDADKTYNPMDRAGLRALAPSLDWDRFFADLGYPALDGFIVSTPDYLRALGPLLEATPPETLRAYLRFRVVSAAAPYLSKRFDAAHFAFYGGKLSGQQEQNARWKRCVRRTEGALGEVLGRAYVARAFAGDSKAIALDMIKRVEAEFEAGMADLDWMDDATRAAAVEKSRSITNKIGYPDKWRDYGDLVVTGRAHYADVRASRTFEARFWLDQAGRPVDTGLWYMSPQMVNAYYNPLANEIAFPAGILQPPFFSREYPQAMNYGAMGMVMGHEVSHGFDDEGRKFSASGKLEEWWAPEVAARFEERAACVEEQYAGYEVQPGLKVDGKLTLGENIADLGGLKQSLRAYRKWVAEHGAEPQVAGLTNDQLFFVAYAQAWCTIATPEAEKVQVRSDPHSPARFRVNGPVRNLPEFGEAFGCERGDPMYPPAEDICVVW
jgi:putative endopeptidase